MTGVKEMLVAKWRLTPARGLRVKCNADESWSASDCTKEELDEFLDQLNTSQFKQVEKFFETMPKLSHTIKVKNPNTKVESEVVLEGLTAFFG